MAWIKIDDTWYRRVNTVVVNVLSLRCNPQEEDASVGLGFRGEASCFSRSRHGLRGFV